MKKLFCIVLCLLTLCACGCTQKPARYYGYGLDPAVAGPVNYYVMENALVFELSDAPEIPPPEQQTYSFTYRGVSITDATYRKSYRGKDGRVVHGYSNYIQGEVYVYEDGGINSFYLKEERECDSSHLSNPERYLIAREIAEDLFKVNLEDYVVEISYDDSDKSYVSFTKPINGVPTSEEIKIGLYADGSLASAYSYDVGMYDGDLNVEFRDDLVKQEIDRYIAASYQNAPKKVCWYYKDKQINMHTSGVPFLLVNVGVYFEDGESFFAVGIPIAIFLQPFENSDYLISNVREYPLSEDLLYEKGK